jgi:SAM-dependent methyltransferase
MQSSQGFDSQKDINLSALERLGIKGFQSTGNVYSRKQTQTSDCFAFKWAKRDTYESDAVKQIAHQWLLERYCDGDPERISQWLKGGRKIILDAGCGSGFSALLLFGDRLKCHDYLGVDISTAIEIAEQRFSEQGISGDFLQTNILDLPFGDEMIDFVFSEGVLHHTDDTEKSIRYLSRKLKRGGRFLFYVYAKKGVIREFTDDYIRNCIKDMSDGEAWEAIKPLTKLGNALGKLDVEIDIPEDIPFLGIKKGRINLQRFLYYNVFKMFYQKDFTLDEMNHINFDWFRPLNCHRHTEEEIKAYCRKAGLTIEHIDVQGSGITIVSRKL